MAEVMGYVWPFASMLLYAKDLLGLGEKESIKTLALILLLHLIG